MQIYIKYPFVTCFSISPYFVHLSPSHTVSDWFKNNSTINNYNAVNISVKLSCLLADLGVKRMFELCLFVVLVFTGPPYGPVLFCSLASVVVVCNSASGLAARRVGGRRPTLHGGPVRLHPIRAKPCFFCFDVNKLVLLSQASVPSVSRLLISVMVICSSLTGSGATVCGGGERTEESRCRYFAEIGSLL